MISFFLKRNNLRIFNKKKVVIGKNPSFSPHTYIHADGEGLKIGDNCVLEYGAYIRLWRGKIEIGDNFYLGPYSVLYGHGGVSIGNHVIIASHVTIIPANHNYKDLELPISLQGETRKGIKINDGVWIATGATILDGVEIGKNSVVAAGAVVTRDVPPFSVVGGIPAKVISSQK